MNEHERDKYSNECITKATSLYNEARDLLNENKIAECILKNYEAAYTSMKAVLAIDDIFPEDDFATERNYRQRYINNGMMSQEFETTLDKITETYDHMSTDPDYKASKPEAGYFTSKVKFFIEETADYIVQRNALYWGQ